MSTWRFAEALPLLETIHEEAPERGDYALSLADCQCRLGLLEEAGATAREAVAANAETAGGRFMLGNVALEQGNVREALAQFRAAEEAGAEIPELPVRTGFAYLKLRRWQLAEQAFQKALAIDPHNALAHQGLGMAQLRSGRPEEAARSMLTSIAFRHDAPQPHYWLGVSLTRLGEKERAVLAFRTALSFQPPLRASHRWLAGLYGDTASTVFDAAAAAAFHRQAARDALAQGQARRRNLETIRQEARFRAIDRADARRDAAAAGGETARPVSSNEENAPLTFTVVSGLPRSGTSLMMQMLAKGGVAVMTDAERKPDEDNPEGYFEWEKIREVAARPEILREAEGRAIKVISMLLPALPAVHRYKVIFMDRPVEEVVASQQKMLERRGTAAADADAGEMARALTRHRKQILNGLRRASHFEVLVVDYPGLVRDPESWAARVAAFAGAPADAAKMAGVVRADLYRNRGAALLQEHSPDGDE